MPPFQTDISETILIIDDQEQNLQLLSTLLGTDGHEGITATSGQRAFELLSVHPPALILLDVLMPEMNGIEVCPSTCGLSWRRLRSDMQPLLGVMAPSRMGVTPHGTGSASLSEFEIGDNNEGITTMENQHHQRPPRRTRCPLRRFRLCNETIFPNMVFQPKTPSLGRG